MERVGTPEGEAGSVTGRGLPVEGEGPNIDTPINAWEEVGMEEGLGAMTCTGESGGGVTRLRNGCGLVADTILCGWSGGGRTWNEGSR